ncbi:MAG: hypothetical protein HY855_23120 [Burkholderiales bacterium]|nr:hypothetical protein [Burkholderiales bacterium]
MSTITDLHRRRRASSVAHCAPREAPCSTCGMLECLCRPRFFAGQVLSADDLNRLDAYIRGKHRLHNRQLHGWGVVNGLEVTCAPCGNGVNVGCGYAISPCGEDIVVCDTVPVDVCALIQRCLPRLPECDPPRPGALPCPEGEQEWVLAIRYAESPTRGVQPLYGSAPAACGCGNAGCGGGCGCKGQAAPACPPARPRGAPVQCEPTVVCEGYSFEVYRKPARQRGDDKRDDESELLRRMRCCIEALMDGAPTLPDGSPTSNPAGWQNWAVRFKAHLLMRLSDRPGTHCDLIARLQALHLPGSNDPQGLGGAIELLWLVALDAMLNCLCSALLPPCPLPDPDGRVPLATLHVSGGDCRVLRICNWSTERRIALTWPAIEYWMSAVPIVDLLRQLLQDVCCFDVTRLLRRGDRNLQDGVDNPAVVGGAVIGGGVLSGVLSGGPAPDMAAHEASMLRLNPLARSSARLDAFAHTVAQALSSPDRTVSAGDLMQGLLGGRGKATLRTEDMPGWLLDHQLARPLAALLGGSVGSLLEGGVASLRDGGAAPERDSGLAQQLNELAARVQAQQAVIDELRSAMATKPASPPPAQRGRK